MPDTAAITMAERGDADEPGLTNDEIEWIMGGCNEPPYPKRDTQELLPAYAWLNN